MKITKPQIKRIHAMLPESIKNDPEAKAELIQQFSAKGCTSTKELSVEEAKYLIGYLEQSNEVHPRFGAPANGSANLKGKQQTMRRKILSICHELGWYQEGTTTLDYDRLGRFCEKYGNAHKRHLNDHSYQELVKLVTQFEQLLEKEYKKAGE